jgi:hypothetical protein
MSLQQQIATATGGSGTSAPADGQSNAPSLVVPMSTVIPKQPLTPAASTPPTTPPAAMWPQTAGTAAQPTTPPANTPMTAQSSAAGAGAAPMTAAAGSAAPSGSAPGAETSGVPEAELAMLRDLCVEQINMYRATLPDKMLMPLKRASAEQEECSQRAAKMDGDTMQGHGAFRAGLCSATGLAAQNSCPGYPVGGFGGATIAETFKTCLAQMWAEGEPPVSRQQCMQDSTGCFLMHGHYLNMTEPNYAAVSCSFYKMMDGRSYWMSQDFAYGGGGFPWGMR